MKTLFRGVRGISRSPLRTSLLAGLLAVSMGLSLIMMIVNEAFAEHINQIRSTVGTDIYVRPANGTMPEDNATSLMSIPHVSKLAKKLSNTYVGKVLSAAKPTAETIAILQQRGVDKAKAEQVALQMDISVVGADTPDALSLHGRRTTGLGVTTQPSKNVKIVAGSTFSSDNLNANVAVINQDLAKSNNLSIGSMLDLNGTNVKIIGLFVSESGDLFSTNALFLPLETAQRIFKQSGKLSEAIIYVDDVGNVDTVVASMSDKLGNTMSITKNTEAYEKLAAPLENAQNGSKMGMIAALIASVAVILFSMFQTVRSRIKEIGILKAIGASNGNVIAQFGVEALVIGAIAAAIGALATFLLAQTIANGLLGSPAGTDGMGLGQIEVIVSPLIIFYAFGLAIGLALVGSCIPSWSVARIKPAEVLRHE
jgi:ABC-type antimicrobial peptide transport system permease subunit